jgi:uncharacterized damage-inducible protein DinB
MITGQRIAAVDSDSERSPGSALSELLDDLMRLLMGVPDHVYSARPARGSGSIGGHVRHVLDHIAALVAASPRAPLSYDHRSRGTPVESDPHAAVREILKLNGALERWEGLPLESPVAVRSMISDDGRTVTGWSSAGRELAFVVSHTIHHYAMIALLLEMQGYEVANERFGYAPSTPPAAGPTSASS